MQFLEKLCKMWEKIEILNLSQQKEKETIWSRNQIIVLQILWQKFIGNKMKKAKVLMNKPVNLGLSILALNKILVYGL